MGSSLHQEYDPSPFEINKMSVNEIKGKGKQRIRKDGDGVEDKVSIYSLPPEVVELIGFYCALSTAGKEKKDNIIHDSSSSASSSSSKAKQEYESENPPAFATPPVNLRNLLVTCKKMHTMLNSESNSRLYARIFKTKFDVEAIYRRFGSDAISSINLSNELKRRCICLKRIRKSVSIGKLRDSNCLAGEEENLEILENFWLTFMMLTENDEKNMIQLRWAKIDEYMQIFRKQDLLEDAMRSGYPSNSSIRSLAIHIDYLLSDPKKVASETRTQSEERLFILRPFVFAAHRYDSFFAPWTIRKLPTISATSGDVQQSSSSSHSNVTYNPFIADLKPKDASTRLTYCGQDINVRPPNITHAAFSSFFMKVEQDPAVSAINTDVEQVADESIDSSLSSESSSDEQENNSNHSNTLNPLQLTSLDHDKDLARLMACSSPHHSPGLETFSHIGDFEGSWEGRFTFFDFDSYRDMLGGKVRSLYEGPFGEQPQVWKLREHIVRIENDQIGGKGNLLNAGYYDDDTEPSQRQTISDDELNLLRSYNHNKDDLLRKKRSRWNDRENDRIVKSLRLGDWISPEIVEDLPNYPSFEDEEVERKGSSSSTKAKCSSTSSQQTQDRYEILISGTGHSAWGRFVLRGRIRSWDGMVSITKEYRPDGRGRWLYRGYLVAGNKIVGRWRDTFTPEDMSGYEGCFIMHRRSGT